jgi:hypothetical protein
MMRGSLRELEKNGKPTWAEMATLKFACPPLTAEMALNRYASPPIIHRYIKNVSISAYAWMRQAEFSRFPKFFLGIFTERPPLRATSARRPGSILAKPFGAFTFPPSRPSTTAAGFFFLDILRSASWPPINDCLTPEFARRFSGTPLIQRLYAFE